MTHQTPRSRFPFGPHRPRNPGDTWAVGPDGTRYWGRFGAAGLLAYDPHVGVLLQHRAAWSHFGGTWGLPGGARHEGEPARDAALREAAEEAGVPDHACRPRMMSLLDLGFWSYTTVVADVVVPFEPRITDAESAELAWVPVDQVDARALHPGFAAAWPALRELLELRPVVVVDVANVMGSIPDGWWRDRAGAAARLLQRLAVGAAQGVPGASLDLPGDVWFPEWLAVVEGQARGVPAPPTADGVSVGVRPASDSGDDEIVAQAQQQLETGGTVFVVTSDRGLTGRVTELGAQRRSTRWLLELLPESMSDQQA